MTEQRTSGVKGLLIVAKANTYPLDPRSVGDDTYIVMSKGHHDPDAFMTAVRAAGYDWPLGKPEHKWVRLSPCGPNCGEHACHYSLHDEHQPGRFPATYAWEAYGDDAYKLPTDGVGEVRNAQP